jgi:hypothetical protein
VGTSSRSIWRSSSEYGDCSTTGRFRPYSLATHSDSDSCQAAKLLVPTYRTLPARTRSLTEQFLAGTPAVHVGGVDAVDSRVNGEVEHGGSLVGAGGTAEEHRAEAERAD